jgi:hypothetical protein
MDPLDRDKLLRLSDLVSKLEMTGFKSLSSPVVVLLEIGIDTAILLREAFSLPPGERPELYLNPIQGSLKDTVDDLGNPKSFKIFPKLKAYTDHRAKEFFNSLSEFLVRFKRYESIEEAFMASFKDFIPESRLHKVQATQETIATASARAKKLARVAYFRRRNKR